MLLARQNASDVRDCDFEHCVTANSNSKSIKCACDWQFMDFWCFIILLFKDRSYMCAACYLFNRCLSTNIHWIFCASKENGNENGNQHITHNISTAPFEIQNVQKFQNRMALFKKKKTVALWNWKRKEKEKKTHLGQTHSESTTASMIRVSSKIAGVTACDNNSWNHCKIAVHYWVNCDFQIHFHSHLGIIIVKCYVRSLCLRDAWYHLHCSIVRF